MYKLLFTIFAAACLISCDNRSPQEIAQERVQRDLMEIRKRNDSTKKNIDSLLQIIRN